MILWEAGHCFAHTMRGVPQLGSRLALKKLFCFVLAGAGSYHAVVLLREQARPQHRSLRAVQEELRQLRERGQACAKALKCCCAALDGAAGTGFAAQDAEIEASAAALMRGLLAAGGAGAAEQARQHVWGRRAAELLPRMEYVLRRSRAWLVRTLAKGGSTRCSGEEWRPLCPLAAVEREAAGLACARPGCAAVQAAASGAPRLRCRGCGTRYCR